MKFVIAGSTGNIGSAVVQVLSKVTDGSVTKITALTRSGSGDKPGLAALKGIDVVDIVECDLSDPASLAAVFKDGEFDAAFLCMSNFHGQVTAEKNFIDALLTSVSCKYLVKIGTVRCCTAIDSVVEYGRFHAEIENYLEENTKSGDLKWTVLSPNWFMSNHLGDVFGTLPLSPSIIAYPVTNVDAGANIVDPREIGTVAAKLLLQAKNPKHDGRKLNVSGPESVSMSMVQTLFAEALGRDVLYVNCSTEDWVAGAVKAGFPDWLAKAISHNFILWEDGGLSFPSSPEVIDLLNENDDGSTSSVRRTMSEWVKEWAPRSPPPASSTA